MVSNIINWVVWNWFVSFVMDCEVWGESWNGSVLFVNVCIVGWGLFKGNLRVGIFFKLLF